MHGQRNIKDTVKFYCNLSAYFSEFVLHIAQVTRRELICREVQDPKCVNLVSG